MPAQRQPGLRIWLGGKPLDRLSDFVLQLEVDERSDEASTFRMTVDMSPIDAEETGDWDAIEHGAFAELHALPQLYLLQRVTIEFSLASDDEAEPAIASTVFDGYVTCVEPVFGEYRVPDSRLILSGIDASCLMHFETVTREWHGRTDAEIATEIFGKYGFAADDTTVETTTPKRELDRSTLVQRCTDAEFLRMLARRNGFEVFVEPVDGEVAAGAHPGRTVKGYFRSPAVDAAVQPTLALFPRDAPSLMDFRAKWESHQPTHVRAWTIDEASRRIERADITAPGYARLGDFDRARILDQRLGEIFATGTRPDPVDIQSADVPHDSLDLTHLARADYRVADWLVTGTGTVRAERYPAIVRSRRPIELAGAGHLLDGRWYMAGVRHRWGIDPDRPEEEQVERRYEPDVTMVRNGLGGIG
ncbi:MAG: hypothetical protein H6842_06865 [Rhodospirillaceae bacterium]|nr:hypothetical protein [Rhodospirillaceae bacterium]